MDSFHPAVQEATAELMSMSPDGNPLQYDMQVDDQCIFSGGTFSTIDYEYGWISGTSFTVTLTGAFTYYWRVQAWDANHTDAVSPWSTVDTFVLH
jgi:hypothetical protein